MANKPIRKLAAIMFTDIVGYTELASTDEEKAFNLIKKKRELLLPLIKKHSGKLIKEIGDGTLTRYFDTEDAIKCANNFQAHTNDDLQVRAGIHTGEVIIENEDVFGDVVNIASRLESIAQPKSIFVSKETIDKLENKESLKFVSLGLQSLKGVGRLIEVYALKDKNLHTPDPNDYKENKVKAHSDDEVPSIAIIPFENKGAEEDVFYAYGISADLISDCSNAGLIRVAGLKDIEKLDYASLNYHELSKQLYVRYIAQGTLWKMGKIFQLSIELYDTKNNKIVWADRWQESWDNLPMIKSSLSDGLFKALDTKTKIQQKPETTNPEAYELYLEAKHKYFKRKNSDDIATVMNLLEKANKIDNNLIVAKRLVGIIYFDQGDYTKAEQIDKSCYQLAVTNKDKLQMAHCLSGIATTNLRKHELETALNYYNKAVAIFEKIQSKRGLALCLNGIGTIYQYKGFTTKAIDYINQFLKLAKEIDNKFYQSIALNNLGALYNKKGDSDAALDYYNKSLLIAEEIGNKPSQAQYLRNIGYIFQLKGVFDLAEKYFKRSLKIEKKLMNKVGISADYNLLGLNYLPSDLDLALEYFEKSLEIKKEIKDENGSAEVLINMGITYQKKYYFQESLDCLNRSLSISEKFDNKLHIGYCYLYIGYVEYLIGSSFKKTLKYYDKANLYFDKIENKQGIATVSVYYAHIYFDNGDFIKAKQKILSAKNIEEQTGLKISLFTKILFSLCQKQFGEKFDLTDFMNEIKDRTQIKIQDYFYIYLLTNDKSYLKIAENQIQNEANLRNGKSKSDFYNFRFANQIIEEYNKVFF